MNDIRTECRRGGLVAVILLAAFSAQLAAAPALAADKHPAKPGKIVPVSAKPKPAPASIQFRTSAAIRLPKAIEIDGSVKCTWAPGDVLRCTARPPVAKPKAAKK